MTVIRMIRPPSPDDAPLRSCLYEARVMHHRLEPRVHRFEYGIFLACLDLDELDTLDTRLRFFSRNRRNWLEFRDSDHLPEPNADTKTNPAFAKSSPPATDCRRALQAWLASQGVSLTDTDRVLLVTLPRIAGYVFNPVSFYFCTRPSGDPICAVAEVGNTFGELKPYVVPLEGARGGSVEAAFRCVVPKHYYVSPFTALDVCFDFRLETPGPRLRIAVNDVHDGRNLLITTLTGDRRPLTDREILRLSLHYPLVTLKVITAIHWHALRLWLKRVPWHAKADRQELQRGVFRPHRSLTDPPPHPGSGPA